MTILEYLNNIPYENVRIIHNGLVVGDRFTRRLYGARVFKYTRIPFVLSILYI